MRKDPIHLLYKELFQIGKRFDQYPVLKLYAKEPSKKLNRIRSLNEPFTPLLYQRFISEKSNNWTHSSEDFELFRELSSTLKYAQDKVKWFSEVPSHSLPKPSVDILDFKNIKEGNILVAHPSLENTNYQQAVVLLLAVSPQEIVGITLNYKLSHKNVYDGGPVKNYTAYDTKLIALYSKEGLFKDGMKVAPNLYYVICKRKELEGINPNDYVLFFGTMRWGRAQLKSEIENDSWVLLDCPIENIYKPVAKTYTETWQKDENGNDYLLIENVNRVGPDVYDTEITRQQELFQKHFNSQQYETEKQSGNNLESLDSENSDENKINNNGSEIFTLGVERDDEGEEEEAHNENSLQNEVDDDEEEYEYNEEIENEMNEIDLKEEIAVREANWPQQEMNEKIHDYINRILSIEQENLGSKIKQLKTTHSKLKNNRMRELFFENQRKRKEEEAKELKLTGWAHPKVLWNHLLTLIGGEISLGVYCFEPPKLKKEENPKIELLTQQLDVIQKGLENLNEESKKLCEETSEISLSIGKLSVKKDKLKEESEKLSHAHSELLASFVEDGKKEGDVQPNNDKE